MEDTLPLSDWAVLILGPAPEPAGDARAAGQVTARPAMRWHEPTEQRRQADPPASLAQAVARVSESTMPERRPEIYPAIAPLLPPPQSFIPQQTSAPGQSSAS